MTQLNKLFLSLFLLVIFLIPRAVSSQAESGSLLILDSADRPISRTTDGNSLKFEINLSANTDREQLISFFLGSNPEPVTTCTISSGAKSCRSEPVSSLGWYWLLEAPLEVAFSARDTDGRTIAAGQLILNPRPVVLVHGFNSSWQAWNKYLGPDGYLAAAGLQGFAVGDGQVAGVMNTGSLDAPTVRTNTIAENASILAEYIRNVQSITGAEKVDLLVHSMGGMISRFYIDRLMPEGTVAQLIVLGTPMAGTECASLPAALGMYLPATLEIQPGYMVHVFNQQIYRRKGVPFYAVAGTQVQKAIQSPCTATPSDLVVSLDSVLAIPMQVQETPLLHTDLNTSQQLFLDFVLPLLKSAPESFEFSPDPLPGSAAAQSHSFTKTYTGTVMPESSESIEIHIDPGVSLANFALFDPSRSLEITVIGASGNELVLDPDLNGFIQVDDPNNMLYLGYGFNDPRPGRWVVILRPGEETPSEGTTFAINAKFTGGANLQARTDVTLPNPGQVVTISGQLVSTENVQLDQVAARVILPDGNQEQIQLESNGQAISGTFTPRMQGIHAIVIEVLGRDDSGMAIDRASTLIIEVQPRPGLSELFWQVALGIAGLFLAALLGSMAFKRQSKKSQAANPGS